jgi:DNA repair protein RadA/Sms
MYRCQNCGYASIKWLGRCPQCGQWESLVEAQRDTPSTPPQALAQIPLEETVRRPTQLAEFDRVLGGGLIPGSVILVGGEPGIGKSTLALQLAARLAQDAPVLYISGEESPGQIKLRAQRLQIEDAPIFIVHEQNLAAIRDHIRKTAASAVIVDSIQTVLPDGERGPGHDLSSRPSDVRAEPARPRPEDPDLAHRAYH